jgi:hypothetical protein
LHQLSNEFRVSQLGLHSSKYYKSALWRDACITDMKSADLAIKHFIAAQMSLHACIHALKIDGLPLMTFHVLDTASCHDTCRQKQEQAMYALHCTQLAVAHQSAQGI